LDPDTNRIRDLRKLTHIISNTSDFEDYESALDNFIQVVKPAWIRACVAKNRQTNPRQYSPDPALFLSEVTVSCADIPEGDKEAIMGGVLAMGGLCSDVVTKLVTHLVALNYEDAKVQAAVKRNPRCKIVAPHW
jgi:hypothetical protein